MSKKSCIFAAKVAKSKKFMTEQYPTNDHTFLCFDNRALYELSEGYFSAHTLQLIDNYVNDILYGRTNLDRFNQSEHAGLCTAGATLIGAYIVCCYARASFEPGRFSLKCKGAKPSNWEIDDSKGFRDNREGEGVNYISDRLYLEDMHPANVFIEALTNKPICIDCIVKFINKD